MKQVPLNESSQSQFDVTNRATVRLGPTVYGQSWQVDTTSVTSDSPAQTQFLLYRNQISPNSIIGGSYSGNQDFNDTTIQLQYGDVIIGQWTGGTPNAHAALNVSGTIKDVR